MRTIITLAIILSIMGCNSINTKGQMSTLPDTLQLGQSLLSRDSVELPEYPVVTQEQRTALQSRITDDIPVGTEFIGSRSVGKDIILEVYKAPIGKEPKMFKVYLVTRKSDGTVIDAVNLREFHTSENQKPIRIGGNRFYTTDAELRFDGDQHIILHRVMTLTSLYLKDHRLTEIWRVEWDNHYEIDAKGHINFTSQQETLRSPADINDPTIDEYQARDKSK